MAAKHDNPPQTLVHFTRGADGTKSIATEVVKPGSASAQFLQRMEKHKQAIPCYQAIDLRKQLKEELFEYEYQGIIHFLNADSIELFENLLQKHHYIYTVDIYKIVTAEALQLKKQSIDSQKNNSSFITSAIATESNKRSTTIPNFNNIHTSEAAVKIIPFGYHRHQNEIRMLYISEIKIQAKEANHWLSAKTMNISVSGLKIKSDQILRFKEQQVVTIRFSGLIEKFSKQYPDVDYKIIDISHQDNHQVCCLVKITTNQNEEFFSDLSNFISRNNKKYKIDLDDFIESIRARVFERIYSQNNEQASIFIHHVDDQIILKHILCSDHFEPYRDNLLPILSEVAAHLEVPQWDSENSRSTREQILINIYSFSQQDESGDDQFYYALNSSFTTQSEKNSFMKIANASGKFKGWQLIIRPCQLLHETLANTFLSDLEEISVDEAEHLQLELDTVIATGKIIDASHSMLLETLNLIDSEQNTPIQLNRFICSGDEQPIEIIEVAQQKQRNENRYLLTTAVQLKVFSHLYNGHTLDFSPNGIKVQLDEALTAEIRDSVDISFPGLQNKFKNENLQEQHFRITHISSDRKIVCFNRDRRFVLHEASLFFRRIIDCNKHKLTQCSGDTYRVVRSILFEKLMVRNLVTIPFFVSLLDGILKADYISVNERPNSLLWDFHDGKKYNFNGIFSGSIWEKIIKNCSKNNKFTNYSFQTEIYLTKNKPESLWKIYLTEDFPSLQSLKKYIFNLKTAKYKKVLHLSIIPSTEYDQNLILDEIYEIRSNSQKQSDNFLELLKNIKAVGELIDITDAYL